MSMIVILKSHELDRPPVSVATQTTSVVPNENDDSGAGSQVTSATATLSFVVTTQNSVLVDKSVDNDDL